MFWSLLLIFYLLEMISEALLASSLPWIKSAMFSNKYKDAHKHIADLFDTFSLIENSSR